MLQWGLCDRLLLTGNEAPPVDVSVSTTETLHINVYYWCDEALPSKVSSTDVMKPYLYH